MFTYRSVIFCRIRCNLLLTIITKGDSKTWQGALGFPAACIWLIVGCIRGLKLRARALVCLLRYRVYWNTSWRWSIFLIACAFCLWCAYIGHLKNMINAWKMWQRFMIMLEAPLHNPFGLIKTSPTKCSPTTWLHAEAVTIMTLKHVK